MSKSKTKTAPRKASTALAVRPKKKAKQPLITIEDPKGLLVPQSPVGQLGELATVGALGLAELKLTEAEEKILSEEVNPTLIQFKPAKRDGPATIPYLPHIVYTRWMNRAFGRTGWAIVPTAAPKKADNLVLVPYLLYIHGVPVAAAMGEQEFIENNKQQTYGDVIESTVASALRRCCKRLGIGLEMWDKDWLKKHAKAIGGKSERNDDVHYGGTYSPPIDAEPIGSSQLESKPLTAAQWKRLESIATKAGRDAADVRLWLQKRYSKDLKQVQQADYAEICRALESRGTLPMPGDGQ